MGRCRKNGGSNACVSANSAIVKNTMQQIDIDFEVFKELTARRRSESHTYNEVIRELLDIDNGSTTYELPSALQAAANLRDVFKNLNGPSKGFAMRGLQLPNGTLLRAIYKGKSFSAKITDGNWVNDEGTKFSSPSAAASAITQNNVNGWRFWEAKRPSDSDWRTLDTLSKP